MDKPISVGDLVQVIRSNGCPFPAPDASLGVIFQVVSMHSTEHGYFCSACSRKIKLGKFRTAVSSSNDCYETTRLKRIPPLTELEGEKRDEKLKDDIRDWVFVK